MFIATPFYKFVEPETVDCLRALEAAGHEIHMHATHHIPKGRNELVQMFRKTEHDHILFLDSDQGIPVEAIESLRMLDKPVVSGLYAIMLEDVLRWAVGLDEQDGRMVWLRGIPPAPTLIKGAGGGCLLIHRDVFNKIEWPWFDFELLKCGTIMGEDFSFSRKCTKSGIDVWLQPAVIAGHHKKLDITKLLVANHVVRNRIRESNTEQGRGNFNPPLEVLA